jgi:predicted DNA-binding transcriptional regulator AlpA
MENTQSPAAEKLLRWSPHIKEMFPVSRAHWLAGVSSGKYPKGIRLSPNVTVWKLSEINQLIESLKA